ncbi:glycoside hydrolase family 43 protein [Rubellicoccus peritrichatus]|uniref:Glycoside hydrolase family 43 protein n=1 Tax=Rubellicoccus peritrichatus TaxID=3080537 RepID=A0AAQ3L6W4_9BACT|nr:glycoside hydrolase family 43 protein [Puniceicoccus sp. CR14]WOO39777.1 glycoside hydrolase family 43 protein [Puniceicoccus sp. CR14]
MLKYTNPIIPGFYPDPSICRVGEAFYLVTSTFEWFPSVPVFHSKDLVNWTQLGHCLTRKSQLNLDGAKSSGGIYAPTIRHHNGRFYMVTTDTTGIRNFIVHTDDPAGPWSEPIKVAQGGIDPSLFFDDDGKVYFTANALWCEGLERGLHLWEINVDTGEVVDDEPVFLWSGTGGKYPEAPHIYKRSGWYYLIIAEGGTEFGHMISVARSRSPKGPYESCPNNPILSHRCSANPIQSTGHGDLFEDSQGNWWVVFLGVRHCSYPLVHHLGRETYLAPVSWSDDGWPVINDGKLVDLEMNVERDLPLSEKTLVPVRDDFDTNTLALTWNFRRNPVEESWSLSERPGWLRLACLPGSLNGIGGTALLARRLQHFYARIETAIEFFPEDDYAEAGLTAIMNERHHCEAALTRRHGKKVIIMRKRCASMVTENVVEWNCKGVICLKIQAEEDLLSFFAVGEDGESVDLGQMETRLLSTEMAGGFTGLYVGVYATSNGEPSQNAAYFDWFDYEPENHRREWDRSLEPVTKKPEDN